MISYFILLLGAFAWAHEPLIKFEGKSQLQSPLVFSATSFSKGNSCFLFIIKPDNKVSLKKQLSIRCVDFRPHFIPEGRFYSYLELSEGMVGSAPFGFRVILDQDLKEVRRIPQEFSSPDFLLLGPDHWIGIEYDISVLKSGRRFLNRIVRERKADKILFEWSAADFLKHNESEAVTWATLKPFRNEVLIDLMVINSLSLKGDHLLLGLGTDGIVMMERKTKKILWVFGGLSDEFSLSHLQNNLLTNSIIFDETNSILFLLSNRSFEVIGTDNTRVRKYELNLSSKKLSKVSELRDFKEFFGNQGSIEVDGEILSVATGLKVRVPFDFVESRHGKDHWKIFLGKDFFASRIYRDRSP